MRVKLFSSFLLFAVFIPISINCGGAGTDVLSELGVSQAVEGLISETQEGKIRFKIDLDSVNISKPLYKYDSIEKVTVSIHYLEQNYEFELSKVSDTVYEGYVEGLPIDKPLIVDVYAWEGSKVIYEGQSEVRLNDNNPVSLPIRVNPVNQNDTVSQSPVIKRVVYDPQEVFADSIVDLIVEAYDPSGDIESLRFEWESEHGSFVGLPNSKSVQWKVPEEGESFEMTVSVSNEHAQTSFTFNVKSESGKIEPEIIFSPYARSIDFEWEDDQLLLSPDVMNVQDHLLSYKWMDKNSSDVLGYDETLLLDVFGDAVDINVVLHLSFNQGLDYTKTVFYIKGMHRPVSGHLDEEPESDELNITLLDKGIQFDKNFFARNNRMDYSEVVLSDEQGNKWISDGTFDGTMEISDEDLNQLELFSRYLNIDHISTTTTVFDQYFVDSTTRVNQYYPLEEHLLFVDNGSWSLAETDHEIEALNISGTPTLFHHIERNLVSEVEDSLFFVESWGKLWMSEGISSDPSQVMESNNQQLLAFDIVSFDDTLLTFHYHTVNRVDESGENPELLLDEGTFYRHLGHDEERLFFSNPETLDFGGPAELWVLEEGSDEPKKLKEFEGMQQFSKYPVHDGVLYFTASDDSDNFELWKSDGTKKGTKKVKDLLSEGSAMPIDGMAELNPVVNDPFGMICEFNDHIYFRAMTDESDSEPVLVRTDGTKENTVVVRDESGEAFKDPIGMSRVSDKLIFISEGDLFVINVE